jgi:hypothetical protein
VAPAAAPNEELHAGDTFAWRFFIACCVVMWGMQILQLFGIPWYFFLR